MEGGFDPGGTALQRRVYNRVSVMLLGCAGVWIICKRWPPATQELQYLQPVQCLCILLLCRSTRSCMARMAPSWVLSSAWTSPSCPSWTSTTMCCSQVRLAWLPPAACNVHACLLVIGAGATDKSGLRRPCPPDGLHIDKAAKVSSASLLPSTQIVTSTFGSPYGWWTGAHPCLAHLDWGELCCNAFSHMYACLPALQACLLTLGVLGCLCGAKHAVTPAAPASARRYENFDEWPYNDGVMLWNLPYMRRTNKAFVDWTLSQRNGLWFEGALAHCVTVCPSDQCMGGTTKLAPASLRVFQATGQWTRVPSSSSTRTKSRASPSTRRVQWRRSPYADYSCQVACLTLCRPTPHLCRSSTTRSTTPSAARLALCTCTGELACVASSRRLLVGASSDAPNVDTPSNLPSASSTLHAAPRSTTTSSTSGRGHAAASKGCASRWAGRNGVWAPMAVNVLGCARSSCPESTLPNQCMLPALPPHRRTSWAASVTLWLSTCSGLGSGRQQPGCTTCAATCGRGCGTSLGIRRRARRAHANPLPLSTQPSSYGNP